MPQAARHPSARRRASVLARRPPRRVGAHRRRRRAVDRRAVARLVGADRRGRRARRGARAVRCCSSSAAPRTTSSLDLTRTRVVVGERAVGALTLSNTGRRAILPSRVVLPVGAGRGVFAVGRLAAGESAEELFAIPTHRRGVVEGRARERRARRSARAVRARPPPRRAGRPLRPPAHGAVRGPVARLPPRPRGPPRARPLARRRVVPRAARVPAGRRPAPRALEVDRAHGHASWSASTRRRAGRTS